MQQLQFVELDEGGRLVLTGDDGTQYAVRVDDRLRAALRPRPGAAKGGVGGPAATVSPRDATTRAAASRTRCTAVRASCSVSNGPPHQRGCGVGMRQA